MEITPFEQLPITTMTLVLTLNNSIHMEAAFHLLPITRISIQQTRESSKCKLPHCSVPGSILSMRYHNNVRGIIRSNAKPFKNAVTIDISTVKKNISLKLSPFSIQMCGASSREDGIEAATHVINHLTNIQKILDLMNENPNETKEVIEWLKNITQGEFVERSNYEVQQLSNCVLRIYRPENDHLINKQIDFIPSHLNQTIVQFLLPMVSDFIYHNDLCRKLEYILTLKSVIETPLIIQHINEAMVNYNYSLGFEVDRVRLNEAIDGKNGFISRYNNALSTSVICELIYEAEYEVAIKRRKNKIPHHTFLIYRSGSVTQSGPGGKSMRNAYYLFRSAINELRPYIEYKQPTIINNSLQIVSQKCMDVNQ